MRAEIGLDGTGALIDVGCGPGVLAVQLAPLFDTVIGIDPEPEMLAEARRHAADHDVTATWIEARAEDLATLDLPAARLVTFGQSIHWTDRQPVLAMVYELLEPGGAVALIAPAHRTRIAARRPAGPADPARRDRGVARSLPRLVTQPASRHLRDVAGAVAVRRIHVAYAPGRTDIVRTTDEVVSGYLSMSFAAPDRFGDRLDAFVADLQALLDRCRHPRACSTTGQATPPSSGRPSPHERGLRRQPTVPASDGRMDRRRGDRAGDDAVGPRLPTGRPSWRLASR